MTRKEQILQAARNYVSGVTLSSPSDVIHFENGAKWADEHPNLERLWHDAIEEPQGDEWHIAYIDVFGSIQSLKCPSVTFDTFPSFADFAAGVGMQCWAYISDLLPKGDER